jgi:hypothetical protein
MLQHLHAVAGQGVEGPLGIALADVDIAEQVGKHVAAAVDIGFAAPRVDVPGPQQRMHPLQRDRGVGAGLRHALDGGACMDDVAHHAHGAARIGQHDGDAGAEQGL